MIEIKNLHKSFGPIRAVDGVSFSVERGTVLGFLGPNGAGKSTTMKMLTGFLHPTSGTATVCGHDVLAQPIQAKRQIGYLPEGAPLYPDMTPADMLDYIADVRGIDPTAKRARIAEVAGKVHLEPVLHQRIETLSKGYKRRVGLAQAILHDPPVLVLDEPTDGLDPNQKHEVRALIRSMAKDKVIILSTHILEEVEAVCTRVIIIAGGKIVVDCAPTQLAARSRYYNAVTISVPREQADRVARALEQTYGADQVEQAAQNGSLASVLVRSKDRRSIVAEIGRRAHQEGWEIDGMRVDGGRLDEVFRELTSSTKAN
jgi:ABC-2 type transport system ATP-binding protein